MKLPNWLKIIWWILLIVSLGILISFRLIDVVEGNGSASDFSLIFLWIALSIAPLFKEISLPGINIKNELEELKSDLRYELINFRNSFTSSVDAKTIVYSNIPSPPPDYKLPEIEEKIKILVKETITGYQNEKEIKEVEIETIDANVRFLFSARYALEREIRRIRKERIDKNNCDNRAPINIVIRELINSQILEPQFGQALKEVYSVCSPAIHGEEISLAKVNFVKDLAPELLAVLRNI